MNQKTIDKISKFTLNPGEILQVRVTEGTSDEIMQDVARTFYDSFPELRGKWLVTNDALDLYKMTKPELIRFRDMADSRLMLLDSQNTDDLHLITADTVSRIPKKKKEKKENNGYDTFNREYLCRAAAAEPAGMAGATMSDKSVSFPESNQINRTKEEEETEETFKKCKKWLGFEEGLL